MINKIVLILIINLMFFKFVNAQNKNVVQSKNKEQTRASERFVKYVEEREEYAVYEAVIKEKFTDSSDRIVAINKKANTCSFKTEQLYIIDELEKIDFSSKILEELKNDCATKEEGVELKADSFKLKGKVVLFSEYDLAKIFYPDCEEGWKSFYNKYPKSNGNMSLSRVGFNVAKNLAVVNFGNQRECLNGYGQIIFLQMINGIWKIKKTQPTWVS